MATEGPQPTPETGGLPPGPADGGNPPDGGSPPDGGVPSGEGIPAESQPEPASLKQPIQLGSTGLRQLLQCYHVGTDEIRETLMQECDVIIECRVCRSLYRGLPNFLAHKKSYCLNRFSGTLVRFQDMANKEDEAYMFGSQVIRSSGTDTFSHRPAKQKTSEFAKVHAYYQNIQRVGDAVKKVQTTDSIVELDDLPGTSAAVAQSVADTSTVPDVAVDRKRKAEEEDRQNRSKQARIEGSKTAALNGVFARSSGDKVRSLRGLFKKAKLTDGVSNKCLQCDDSNSTTYKSLKSHIKKKHLKTRSFHRCPECDKLYSSDEMFIHHLLNDHRMPQPEAVAATSMDRVVKFVINGNTVYDIPLIPGLEAGEDSHRAKEETARPVEQPPEEVEEEEVYDDEDPAEEMEEDYQGEHGSPKRGSYPCPKSFWLTIMRCLGIYKPGAKPRRYQCPRHPKSCFQKYTDYKDHAISTHIHEVIKCPMCKAKFKKYNHVAKFGKHLKLVHQVSEISVWKLKDSLRRNMLIDNINQWEDAAQDDPLPEEFKEFEDVEEPEPEPELAPAKPQLPGGTMEYQCLHCSKSLPDRYRINNHMMMSHGMTSEQVKECKEELEERKFFKPFRGSSRSRPREMEGGITSTFNLDDYFCPLCRKHFPSLHPVINHLKVSHGSSKEELIKYKSEVKAEHQKRREQHLKTLCGTGRGRGRQEEPAELENEDEEEVVVKAKRKQSSPLKTASNGQTSPLKTTPNGQTSPTKTPPNGGALSDEFKCPKCQRRFAKQCGLTTHINFCVKSPRKATTPVKSESSDEEEDEEEEDETHEEEKQKRATQLSLSRSALMRALMERRMPDIKCKKCGKCFNRKSSCTNHEMYCRAEADSESVGVSTDSEDLREIPDAKTPTDVKPSVMYKVFKCPLCDIEDLELHQINHHLMNTHGWTSAKVAARRDILKRSVAFKTVANPSKPSAQPSSPTKDSQPQVKVERVPSSEPITTVHVALATDFTCSLCPKSYPELWKLTYHWQMCHGLDSATVARMKKDVQEDRRRHLAELRTAQRSTRRGAAENAGSGDDGPGLGVKLEGVGGSSASSTSSVKLITI